MPCAKKEHWLYLSSEFALNICPEAYVTMVAIVALQEEQGTSRKMSQCKGPRTGKHQPVLQEKRLTDTWKKLTAEAMFDRSCAQRKFRVGESWNYNTSFCFDTKNVETHTFFFTVCVFLELSEHSLYNHEW